MHLKSFVVRNYRCLREVRIDLEADTSILVGGAPKGQSTGDVRAWTVGIAAS